MYQDGPDGGFGRLILVQVRAKLQQSALRAF